MSRVHLKIRAIAARKRISQGKLSRNSDVDVKTIRRIYRDPFTVVTTETLGRIADVLGVDVSELIESVSKGSRVEEIPNTPE